VEAVEAEVEAVAEVGTEAGGLGEAGSEVEEEDTEEADREDLFCHA
jgi:hypothetical protein